MLGTARLAGIGAAKRTGELIPLAHPLALDLRRRRRPASTPRPALVVLTAEAGTIGADRGRDGGDDRSAVAALTVYDMVKGLERGVAIEASSWSRRAAGAAATGSASREPGGARAGRARRRRADDLDVEGARRRRGRGGPALAAFAERLGVEVVGTEVIPDERELIEEPPAPLGDEGGCELILTTGGTGFAPDDVTPEATRAVIEREAPGIGEAMRAASREHTPHVDGLARASRARAGAR